MYSDSELKSRFFKRIQTFIKRSGFKVKESSRTLLMDFFYDQFIKQGRLNPKTGGFHLTGKFIYQAVSDFLNVSAHDALDLFKISRKKRASSPQPANKEKPLAPKKRGSLIDILGRKHKIHYKMTKRDGSALSPNQIKKTQGHFSGDVSFSPLKAFKASSTPAPRQRALASDEAIYEQDMFASEDIALWRRISPQKNANPSLCSPNRVRFFQAEPQTTEAKKAFVRYDTESKKNTTEYFEFKVTRDDLIHRMNARRPVTQKQTMGGVSAKDVVESIGELLCEKQSGRDYHWAHRQGFTLKGEQSPDNLDPVTAGSNFDTLFKVEQPIKALLWDKKTHEVGVKGRVDFGENGLPFKISYHISWDERQFVEVIIDPMSHRIPTVDENKSAESFFRTVLNFDC